MANRGAAARQAFAVEGGGDRRHVIIEAALRQQSRDHQGFGHRAPNGARRQGVENSARPGCDAHDHENSRDPAESAIAVGVILAVEMLLQPPDQQPQQHDWVWQAAENGRRVPNAGIERQRRQEQQQRIDSRGIGRKEREHRVRSIGARGDAVNRWYLQSDLARSAKA